jgi:outer membrane PBP1 activator LpoA protein
MMASEMDQKWQELQDRIENVFGPLLRGDIQKIEYKPQAPVHLLGLSSDYQEHKPLSVK